MSLSIELVGAQPHEQHPSIALYAFDIRGRVAGKLAVADKGELNIEPHRLPPIVALGPDVADPASLDPAGLMTLRVSDQVDAWRETNAILVPGPWWRRWPGFQTCLTGTAERCFPFGLNVGDFRNIALGRPSIFERCAPLCNAVVEIWESTTCCWPFPIWEVPRVISGLRQFLADNPVMFPQPPRPDPGPPDRVLAASVDQALARSAPSRLFVPSTDLALHLTTLQSLESSEALQYRGQPRSLALRVRDQLGDAYRDAREPGRLVQLLLLALPVLFDQLPVQLLLQGQATDQRRLDLCLRPARRPTSISPPTRPPTSTPGPA